MKILLFISISAVLNCVVSLSVLSIASSENVTWILENRNGSIKIPSTVPGGVYSDLQKAHIIGDIFKRFNDVLTRWVSYDTWTYTGTFEISADQIDHRVMHLVFEGVDTIAYVELNDQPIGNMKNMFQRYVFEVNNQLKLGINNLRITFASPVESALIKSKKHFVAPACVPDEYHGECHVNQIRKMQASFGWDWGPAFPSVGIWKPLYIEFYNTTVLKFVTIKMEEVDDHWNLNIKAHLESSKYKQELNGIIKVSLRVDGDQSITRGSSFSVTTKDDGTGETEIDLAVSKNVISLWWPNGFGDQPLYALEVSILSQSVAEEVSYKKMNIGFRTLEVVEEDINHISNSSFGEGLSFYFKVNGYPIFMKGSNWIPAHILPELGDNREIIDGLLSSAKSAHMSMLRVWGGGVYESDYFYERCDQLGILIWQDFLFACAMYPAESQFLENVKTEIEQNVIRLQYHPSIAVWAGNNENEVALRGNWYQTQPQFEKYKEDYIKLYVDSIKPVVNTLDPGRRYLVSSPSNGLKSEEDGYIAQNPYDSHYGDTHYYNYIADNWDQNVYPQTRFASEYGLQSLPSISTMKTATTVKEDFQWNSEYSRHRQHSPNGYNFISNQIEKHMILNEDDPQHFEKFIFYSQISQAMSMKAETEYYRQSQADWYTMGALYWQLNDVWQAPSWSGIEYGGKWKLLHYFAKSFFAPVLVSPRLLLSGVVDVYLLNDRFVPIEQATVIVDLYNWTSFMPIQTSSFPVDAAPLSAKKQNIDLSVWHRVDPYEVFYRFSLKAEGVESSPFNFVFPKPFKSVKGLKKPKIQLSVDNRIEETVNTTTYTVNIKSDAIVLFLWLETDVRGYFEDNGFIVTQPSLRVSFVSEERVKPVILKQSIAYKYYMH